MLSLFIILMLVLLAENGRALEEVPTPSITAEPTSATGLQGGVVIFKCNTLIDEDKTVYLFRGSRKIFEFRSISEPVAFFTLRNLTSKSDGTYRCISEIFRPRRRKSRPSNTIRLTMLDTQAPLSILRPSSAVVTEGSNVNMTCTANMQYNCVFYVFRGNRYSPIHLGQRRNNTSISILNVTLGDAGKYTCHCLVEVNGIFVLSTPSHFMELTVIEEVPTPSITAEPTSATGLQGGVVIFKCNTLIDEDKTVYLFRGSRMIFEFRSISEPVAFFTIRNLTSKSDGTYRCISEMFQPRRRKSRPSNTIRLTMLDTQAPLSILRPSSAVVTEGNNVNMTCTANMQYSCVFYVFRGNRYSPIHLGQRRNNTSISILNVTLGDSGKYTCHCLVEVNGIFVLSTPSHFMELTVIESVPKPNITFEPKSGIGLQGGIITVKCEIPSTGEKIVYLSTGSNKMFGAVTLSKPAVFFTLANLSSRTPRNYRCMYEMLVPKKGKSGPSDEIQLTVLDFQAPSSFLYPTSAEVTEGSNLLLTCKANTKHQCFFYEYSDDEYSPYQPATAVNKTSFSMYSLRRSDAGKYVCHCLVEVKGTIAFSAPSNVMELSVIANASAECEEGVPSEYGGLLVVALGVTVFIVLILMSAILAIRLSKRRYSPENKETE